MWKFEVMQKARIVYFIMGIYFDIYIQTIQTNVIKQLAPQTFNSNNTVSPVIITNQNKIIVQYTLIVIIFVNDWIKL